MISSWLSCPNFVKYNKNIPPGLSRSQYKLKRSKARSSTRENVNVVRQSSANNAETLKLKQGQIERKNVPGPRKGVVIKESGPFSRSELENILQGSGYMAEEIAVEEIFGDSVSVPAVFKSKPTCLFVESFSDDLLGDLNSKGFDGTFVELKVLDRAVKKVETTFSKDPSENLVASEGVNPIITAPSIQNKPGFWKKWGGFLVLGALAFIFWKSWEIHTKDEREKKIKQKEDERKGRLRLARVESMVKELDLEEEKMKKLGKNLEKKRIFLNKEEEEIYNQAWEVRTIQKQAKSIIAKEKRDKTRDFVRENEWKTSDVRKEDEVKEGDIEGKIGGKEGEIVGKDQVNSVDVEGEKEGEKDGVWEKMEEEIRYLLEREKIEEKKLPEGSGYTEEEVEVLKGFLKGASTLKVENLENKTEIKENEGKISVPETPKEIPKETPKDSLDLPLKGQFVKKKVGKLTVIRDNSPPEIRNISGETAEKTPDEISPGEDTSPLNPSIKAQLPTEEPLNPIESPLDLTPKIPQIPPETPSNPTQIPPPSSLDSTLIPPVSPPQTPLDPLKTRYKPIRAKDLNLDVGGEISPDFPPVSPQFPPKSPPESPKSSPVPDYLTLTESEKKIMAKVSKNGEKVDWSALEKLEKMREKEGKTGENEEDLAELRLKIERDIENVLFEGLDKDEARRLCARLAEIEKVGQRGIERVLENKEDLEKLTGGNVFKSEPLKNYKLKLREKPREKDENDRLEDRISLQKITETMVGRNGGNSPKNEGISFSSTISEKITPEMMEIAKEEMMKRGGNLGEKEGILGKEKKEKTPKWSKTAKWAENLWKDENEPKSSENSRVQGKNRVENELKNGVQEGLDGGKKGANIPQNGGENRVLEPQKKGSGQWSNTKAWAEKVWRDEEDSTTYTVSSPGVLSEEEEEKLPPTEDEGKIGGKRGKKGAKVWSKELRRRYDEETDPEIRKLIREVGQDLPYWVEDAELAEIERLLPAGDELDRLADLYWEEATEKERERIRRGKGGKTGGNEGEEKMIEELRGKMEVVVVSFASSSLGPEGLALHTVDAISSQKDKSVPSGSESVPQDSSEAVTQYVVAFEWGKDAYLYAQKLLQSEKWGNLNPKPHLVKVEELTHAARLNGWELLLVRKESLVFKPQSQNQPFEELWAQVQGLAQEREEERATRKEGIELEDFILGLARKQVEEEFEREKAEGGEEIRDLNKGKYLN